MTGRKKNKEEYNKGSHSASSPEKRKKVKSENQRSNTLAESSKTKRIDVSDKFDEILEVTSVNNAKSSVCGIKKSKAEEKVDLIKRTINNKTLENEISFGDFSEQQPPFMQKEYHPEEQLNGMVKLENDSIVNISMEEKKDLSAQLELNDFKNKLSDILNDNGGHVSLSAFCIQFDKLYGKKIKNWFKHRKIQKVIEIFTEECTDILMVDTTSSRSNIFLNKKTKSKGALNPSSKIAKVGANKLPMVKPVEELKGRKEQNEEKKSIWKSVPDGILETPKESLHMKNSDPTPAEMLLLGNTVLNNKPIDVVHMKKLDPTPAEMLLLGKTVSNNKPIDVVRVTDRRGKTLSTLMEFPDLQKNRLIGPNRPTLEELNEHVNKIRNDTCRKCLVVMVPDVLAQLCKIYNVSSTRYLNPAGKDIMRDTDIPAINTILRLQGKVNAFIQAFIQFRNICTLHELGEEICKMEGKSLFEELKLGPLQKQSLVYEFFKFPSTEKDIPTITTLDVFSTLWKCLSKKRREEKKDSNDRLTLEEFMEFLIEKYGFSDPFESGVRIGSIALAIQVTKKAAFGDMHNIRDIKQEFYNQLCEEFNQHLSHASKQFIRNGQMFHGDPQTLIQRISGMNILDGFTEMNKMLINIEKSVEKILPRTENIFNFADRAMDALYYIQKDKLLSRFFHILLSTAPLIALHNDDITILNYLGFENSIKSMAEKLALSHPKRGHSQHAVAPKAKVIDVSKKWLSNITELNVCNLYHVEDQIINEINNEFNAFEELGHGSFLKLITTDKNLRDIVDTAAVNINESGLSGDVTRNDIMEFVHQCEDDNEQDDIIASLKLQFQLNKVDEIFQKLISQILSDKKQCVYSPMRYLHAILCGSEYYTTSGYNDDKGAEHAKSKIFSAPYLSDLNEWLNWDVMYRRKLGNLKEFIIANFKEQDYKFLFLETRKDCFIKLMKECSVDMFLESLKDLDALKTSTYLVSIINSSDHVKNAPIALLSNHTQSVFLGFDNRIDDLLKFCLDCFLLIPFEMLCCVINKIFLDPLATLCGRLEVGSLLLNACEENSKQQGILHALGFQLSINEWIKDYERLLQKEVLDRNTGDEKHADIDSTLVEQEKPVPESILCSSEKNDTIESDLCIMDSYNASNATISDPQDSQQILYPDVSIINDVNIASLPQTVIEETSDATERLASCQQFIEDIRREQFGIGQTFGEVEQKLIDVHREREGRALNRLSRELYTKDSHFVLELIQNADDNDYPAHFMTADANEKPTVAFIVESDKVTILNNEVGFMEKNIKALCDVGKSTKGIHRKGYIGQKGIGFKSVFRVTDCPEIHSNGYHIKFDASSGANGYILPQWVDGPDNNIQYDTPMNEKMNHYECTWTTKIVLRLKTEMQHTKLTSRFHDIHPSLLMFLNRLHKIIIDDRVLGAVKVMYKEKIDKNLIRLSENDSTSLWFVASDEIPMDLREDVKTTDISVAFPIEHSNKTEILSPQPVFAFLPLRSYGFKFVIQADFEVPSSREDIDKDSSWNQCILQHIPKLVVTAFHAFKDHDHFSGFDGIIEYFKFMDLSDHVLGIFKQVAAQISKSLQREACLPVYNFDEGNSQEICKWAVPHSVSLSKTKDNSIITPDILQQHLGLSYIHKDVQQEISPNVYSLLGVKKLSLEQLIEIAKTVVHTGYYEQEKLHQWLGEWLYVVLTCMQEEYDYSEKTLEKIKSLKIFALCDGTFTSLKDTVVFFPIEHDKKQSNKTWRLIENDLSILSHAMISTLDVVKHQLVIKLLEDLGVKTLRPSDLIHDYIIQLFKNGIWKEKAEDLVVACIIYLHQQYSLNENVYEINDIKDHIALKTNKGMKSPSRDVIYLTKAFGNELDLGNTLSACDWTLIENVYSVTKVNRKSWKDFFLALGLKTFVTVQKTERKLHKSDLASSVWKTYSETWEETDDETYLIQDLMCPEFDALIQSGNNEQIYTFACTLDKHWDEYFKRYDLAKPKCLIKNLQGEIIGSTTYSSFFLKIRNLSWIQSSEKQMHVPRELFYATDYIKVLLANKVQYMTSRIQNKDFICTLGVETELSFQRFVEEFEKWRAESTFTSTYVHTQNIYEYLKDKVSPYPGMIANLLKEPFFFLPEDQHNLSSGDSVHGKFYRVKEVFWEDSSGIITQTSNSLSQRRILLGYYPREMRDFFVRNLGVDEYPSCAECLNVVSNIANETSLPDKKACQQILSLFALLSENVITGNFKQEFENLSWPNSVKDQVSLYTDLQDYINPEIYMDFFADSNIFPTFSNRFVSLDDKPILVLNEELSTVYKKDTKLPMIFLKDIQRMLENKKDNQHQQSRKRRNENIGVEKKLIKILTFFKACNLPLLQDIVEIPDVVPEMPTKGFATWEQFLHDVTPYIQRYLHCKFHDIYLQLQDKNFADYLKNSSLFKVKDLQVIHRLYDRETVNISLPKACNVQDMSQEKAFIYIVTGAEDSKTDDEDVLHDLMELFVGPSETLKETLSNFITFFNLDREKYLRRNKIGHIPEEDTVWEYPEPEQIQKPIPSPRSETVTETVTARVDDGEQILTCWPPRNPNASGSISAKSESAKKEEKWKQPDAPSEDNMKITEVVAPVVQLFSNPDGNMIENNLISNEVKRSNSEIFHNEIENNRTSNDVKRKSSDMNQTEIEKHETSRESSEVSPSKQTSNTNIIYDSEKQNKTKNPPSNINTPDYIHNGGSPASKGSMVTKNEMPSNFDASTISHVELLEQYEDLPLSVNKDLVVDEERLLQLDELHGKDHDSILGQLGEKVVYQHLCAQYKDEIEAGDVFLSWCNEEDETGSPFDIKIIFAKHTNKIYVEVKSTLHDEKKEFEISSQQLKFAFEQGSCFHLYRLSGMAKQRHMKLKRLVNLATYMDNKSVKLYMIL